MKFLILFVLAFVAFAAAAPQLIYPGVVGAYPTTLGARTVVAGPTVVNGGLGSLAYPGRVITTAGLTGITTTGLGVLPTFI